MKKSNKRINVKILERGMMAADVLMFLMAVVLFFGAITLGYQLIPRIGAFVGAIVGFVALWGMECLSVTLDRKIGYYRCTECGCVHTPDWKNLKGAVVKDSEKLMYCPQCREQVAHEKVFRKQENA